MNNKILLIEDDIAISEMVENYLRKEGFKLTVAFNGEEGVRKFLRDTFDIILLDLMMPKLDGIEVIRIIREKSSIPILITSAKDTDVDKAIGLGIGADDYIAKPFSMLELSARIKAAIRRANYFTKNDTNEEGIINVNELKIDFNDFSVMKKGKRIQLTSKEFDILKLFVKNPKRVFTKAQIYSSIWNEDYYGDENVINVHMRRLREKIEDNPSEPLYIKTLWGLGYKLGEF